MANIEMGYQQRETFFSRRLCDLFPKKQAECQVLPSLAALDFIPPKPVMLIPTDVGRSISVSWESCATYSPKGNKWFYQAFRGRERIMNIQQGITNIQIIHSMKN